MQAYSFQDNIALVNGVELTGWADGDDVIQVKRRVDSASDKIGAGGSMVVSISADRSGEFTFKLQQTSPSNAYLQSLMDNQELLGSAFVPVSCRVQDLVRQDLASGTVGYLKKYAEISRGAMAGTQEWGIVVENLSQVFGEAIFTTVASVATALL